MWRDGEPLTLDELTEAMRLAGATADGVELKSSVLFSKVQFVVQKRHSSTRKVTEGATVLRATVGSRVHGLNLPGADDRDEMGVCIEPPEYVIGHANFEQHIERSRPEGERSRPGDLDLVVYSLRKWMKLALSGNPTAILLLFVPEDEWVESISPYAHELQALAPSIVSKRAGHAFLGYMESQRQRLMGERGQKNVKRPELEEAHGFDTKYAMHVLRLGFQGFEILHHGRLTLPMVDGEREYLMAVRRGEVEFAEVVARATGLEGDVRRELESSELRDEPDRAAVNAWLVLTYRAWWDSANERGR